MDQERVNKLLSESNDSDLERKILSLCNDYIRISANKMSDYYNAWDSLSDIYRGYRLLDREDKDAVSKKEPTKIIVPITYAQTQTALSFIFSTFIQREKFFELRGLGPEDVKHCFALETDLQYQLDRNNYLLILYNWLLSSMKYGFGVVKCDWTTEHARMRVLKQQTKNPLFGGLVRSLGLSPAVEMVEEVAKVISYEGCRLRNISPYSFLPDPNVTLARFQEGLFVGHEEEVSRISLEREDGETLFGVDKIPPSITSGGDPISESKGRNRRAGQLLVGDNLTAFDGSTSHPRTVLRTELIFNVVPYKWSKELGIDLGSSRETTKFVATLGNESKVLRFEPSNYLHDQFNYSLIEWSPDDSAFYNPGLADTIQELQGLITFFLNSHVINVRKVIQNRFVGNPEAIHMDDVNSGAMFIRTRGSAVQLDRAIKQLEVSDVTRNHVNDVDMLAKLVQLVTGVNENALGQYSAGRRSATEARNVNAGAAARLKMHASIAWGMGVHPLGRQMLANTRQGRTKEIYNQIVGELALTSPFEETILADSSKLASGIDFVHYDATLPSDRQQQASVLTELFGLLVSNPASIQLLNKNPAALLDHIAKLYNITNIRDFDLPQPVQPVAQVQPDQVVREQVGAGQATPIDDSGIPLLNELAGIKI